MRADGPLADRAGGERYEQQSQILCPKDAPGVTLVRHLPVLGYDDAPHGHAEVTFENVRVPEENMLREGAGYEIAQRRLGPGRIHHCMRSIGVAERALDLMCQRVQARVAFGRPVAEQTVTLERIADSRIEIDQARLLVLHAAHRMDTVGNKVARQEIAGIKVAVPNMASRVIDRAIQSFAAAGVTEDFRLARMYASQRTLRIADGFDEVHRNQLAKLELNRHPVNLPGISGR